MSLYNNYELKLNGSSTKHSFCLWFGRSLEYSEHCLQCALMTACWCGLTNWSFCCLFYNFIAIFFFPSTSFLCQSSSAFWIFLLWIYKTQTTLEHICKCSYYTVEKCYLPVVHWVAMRLNCPSNVHSFRIYL